MSTSKGDTPAMRVMDEAIETGDRRTLALSRTCCVPERRCAGQREDHEASFRRRSRGRAGLCRRQHACAVAGAGQRLSARAPRGGRCPAFRGTSDKRLVSYVERTSMVSPMPPAAARAALETFARIARERHPGVVLVPLGGVGADGAVVSASAGQVLRPFAAPEDGDSLLDGRAGLGALDDDGVDGA